MKSASEIMPTMMFSMATSHPFAQTHVPCADDEKQHHNADIDQVCHNSAIIRAVTMHSDGGFGIIKTPLLAIKFLSKWPSTAAGFPVSASLELCSRL
jgi:hypothetical protein